MFFEPQLDQVERENSYMYMVSDEHLKKHFIHSIMRHVFHMG